MKQYEVISFDIFQTLVDVNARIPFIWKELLKEDYSKEKGESAASSVLRGIQNLYGMACDSFISMEEFYIRCGEQVLRDTGCKLDSRRIADCIMRQHGLAPFFIEVPLVLQELRKQYTIIISSDASHLMADPIVTKVQPARAFISDDLKSYKGDPKGVFFQKVLEELKLEPNQVLHIGDSSGDVIGATLSGIDSCWLNRTHKRWNRKENPTYEIASLNELKQLL